MKILGIESSCDETGVAVYEFAGADPGTGRLIAHNVHSQIALHDAYGGVVPELASRDHIRRLPLMVRDTLREAGLRQSDLDAVAYTRGPGLAGALLVGASFANSFALALGIPAIGVHHLEGHLLSPLLSADPPCFPFVALLVSGGHTQLMRVSGVGEYALLGETLDDAAGEAFDKTAKLLGLPYPGGPALAALAGRGTAGRFRFPRPMLQQLEKNGDLDFSFSGLKTAVSLACRQRDEEGRLDDEARRDIAAEFQQAVVDVLCAKSLAALRAAKLDTLVVAGGVGANRALRGSLDAMAAKHRFHVHYPELELCTDNGAMIAFAGAMRMRLGSADSAHQQTAGSNDSAYGFGVRPRWELAELDRP